MPVNAKKILIAEDEKALSKALTLKFTREGFTVTVANNGQEALDILDKEKFDVIVLDLVMPKVDGFAVLQKLKDMKNKVPLIVTSNLSQEEDMKRAKALGANEFFIKSDTSLSDLVDHVMKMVA